MGMAFLALTAFDAAPTLAQPSASREQTIAQILEAMAAAHGPIRIERQMVEKSIMDSLFKAKRVYKTPSQLCDPELPECAERVRTIIAADVDRITASMPERVPATFSETWLAKMQDVGLAELLAELGGSPSNGEIPSLQARYKAIMFAMQGTLRILSEESEALYDKVAAATVDLPKPQPPRVRMAAPPQVAAPPQAPKSKQP